MRVYYLVSCLLLLSPLSAQPGSVTEASIKLEQRFIEAKREALLGKTDKAIGMFGELADEAPDDDAIQFELARLQYAAGREGEAINAMKKAYGKRPNEVYAAFLGNIYQSAGRYREGADLYADRVKRNPAAPENYFEQAAFQVRAQDIKGAIATYDDLQKRIGINPELARQKHALYLGTGDQKRAERELTELVEAFPRQLDYRHLLAAYYASQNDAAAARRSYQDILALQPDDVKAQLALQGSNGGNKPAAGNEAETMALLGRPDVDVDLKIGRLLPLVQRVASTQDAELSNEALRLVTELRRVHPDEAKAAALEGDLLFHSGQLIEAGRAYRATIELDDTVYPVWEQLLGTLYLTNESADLREYAERALDIFPNRPAIYVHYALGEAMRFNFEEAASLLEPAGLMVSADPESSNRVASLAAAVSAMADGQSLPAGSPADQLPGGKDGPLVRLINWRSSGDIPSLTTLRALDHPGNTNAVFLELLGDAQLKAGERAAAAGTYVRAKSAGSKSPTLSEKIAQVKS